MSADFGANDWLVEEMYERYQADPTSVEPSWIEFFKTYKPGTTNSAPITNAPKAGTPPIPKATQQVSKPAPSTQPTPAAVVAPPAPVVASPAPVAAATPVAEAADAKPELSGHAVLSPMVGTFYRKPAPDAPNFVEIGSTVSVGGASPSSFFSSAAALPFSSSGGGGGSFTNFSIPAELQSTTIGNFKITSQTASEIVILGGWYGSILIPAFKEVKRITLIDKERGKNYKLNNETAVLLVRPRGLHLNERHIIIDNEETSGSLVDFGLYVFHNTKTLLSNKIKNAVQHRV